MSEVLDRIVADDKLFATVVADLARINKIRGPSKSVDALIDLIEADPSLKEALWGFRDTILQALST